MLHYFRDPPKEDFRRKLSPIQKPIYVKARRLDMDIARLALEQLMKYVKIGISGRDSVILATMKATGVKRIATHDEVFKKIENLEVIDPIPQSRSLPL
jgi:predicted nucleic acid-binding protein